MEGLECQAEVSVHLIERARGCLKVHASSVHCAATDRGESALSYTAGEIWIATLWGKILCQYLLKINRLFISIVLLGICSIETSGYKDTYSSSTFFGKLF